MSLSSHLTCPDYGRAVRKWCHFENVNMSTFELSCKKKKNFDSQSWHFWFMHLFMSTSYIKFNWYTTVFLLDYWKCFVNANALLRVKVQQYKGLRKKYATFKSTAKQCSLKSDSSNKTNQDNFFLSLSVNAKNQCLCVTMAPDSQRTLPMFHPKTNRRAPTSVTNADTADLSWSSSTYEFIYSEIIKTSSAI